MSDPDLCVTELDEEVARVQELLKDTAHLHTLALEAFTQQGEAEYLQNEEGLMRAFNSLCDQIHAPTFALEEEDAEDLFDSRINFAAFFQLTRDYLAAVVRAVTTDDKAAAD